MGEGDFQRNRQEFWGLAEISSIGRPLQYFLIHILTFMFYLNVLQVIEIKGEWLRYKLAWEDLSVQAL